MYGRYPRHHDLICLALEMLGSFLPGIISMCLCLMPCPRPVPLPRCLVKERLWMAQCCSQPSVAKLPANGGRRSFIDTSQHSCAGAPPGQANLVAVRPGLASIVCSCCLTRCVCCCCQTFPMTTCQQSSCMFGRSVLAVGTTVK